jgi:quinol monooxygenase YgiN
MPLFLVKMNVLPEKCKELLQTLEAIVDRVRRETGCVNAKLYQDMENDKAFMLAEEWRNQEDLANYIRSDGFSVLLGANSLLDQAPVIETHSVSHPSGLEAVLKMRS